MSYCTDFMCDSNIVLEGSVSQNFDFGFNFCLMLKTGKLLVNFFIIKFYIL